MNETLQTIHGLRTIHGNFSDRQVSDDDLTTIVEASVRAANASARQSYSIVIVDDPETMHELCGYRASRLLLYCVDYNRICDVAEHLGYTFHAGEPISFVTGTIDTVLAAQTAAIAAKSLGIDTFFTNGIHRGDMRRIYEILDLPEQGCFPLIALLLGYAAEEPEFQKGRLSGAGVVHRGRYRHVSEDEAAQLVAEHDDPERHLGLVTDWEEQGHEHYLEWFYKDWSGPIDASEFYEILGRAGFLER
jgi:nitroreductase